MHDLWGADSLQGGSFSWPGDNGNWTSYDAFLDRVFSDLRANEALEGLDIDIWNEPDLQSFWGSTQDQYLATWARTYARIRKDLPEVLITGPSTSEPATAGSATWQKFAAFIAANDAVPDMYSWHLLRTNRNLRESTDEAFEVYGTHAGTVGSVKVLAAVRPVAGRRTYHVTITGLSSVGFAGDRVKIRTRRFDGPPILKEI